MNVAEKTIPFLPVAFLLLTGCASKYHLGRIETVAGQMYTSTIIRKIDQEIDPFESRCIDAVLNKNLVSLGPIFSPKLRKVLPDSSLKEIQAVVDAQYIFDGKVQRYEFPEAKELKGIPYMDGYGTFDYIESAYFLSGKPGAAVKLFTTKVGEEIRLCGFAIIVDPKTEGNIKPIVHFYPETNDKGDFSNPQFGDFYYPMK